jgi:diguanylate cyclase (GGDEF)-like protein/putative nucleotidyltransferase with HDIG domain
MGLPPGVVRQLLAAGYGVVVAAYLSIRFLPLPGPAADLAHEALLAIVVALTLTGLFGAFRHTTGVERRFWGFALAGGVFLLFGRLHDLVAAGTAIAGGPAAGTWSGVFDIAAVACVLVLLLSMSRFRPSSAAARARYILDLVAAGLVIAGSLEAWVIGPLFDRFAVGSVWFRIVYSASPVVGGLAALGMLTVIFGTRLERWQSWERVLAGSVTVFAAALMLAPLTYASVASGSAGGWESVVFELLWITAAWLGLIGAVYRHLDSARPWHLRPIAALEPSYGWMATVLLPSIALLSLPLFGLAASQAQDPALRTLRLLVVGAIAVTIAVRTLLTVMDTEVLTAGAVTDPLTGLYNHAHFQTCLDREIAAAVRYGEGVSLILLDIDDFAAVNASEGHAAGDAMLVGLSRAGERAVRTRDVFCRLGGDDAAIILPGTDSRTALTIAERVIAGTSRVASESGRRVTVSAGIAALPEQAIERSELLSRASAALDWAKAHGRGHAVVFDAEVVPEGGPEERARNLEERADHATVRALAAAVDARDEATQDHSRNVARHAVALAQEIGLDERTALLLEYAGLLHDIGKIGVPDSVLRKAGSLTTSERESMEAHAALGEAILSSTTIREILPWVRHHHERWDGTGYPDGLRGAAIPLGARIIALANSYDAIRSPRPHRAGLSRTAALQEIDLGLGSAYDPELGEHFIDVIGRTYS